MEHQPVFPAQASNLCIVPEHWAGQGHLLYFNFLRCQQRRIPLPPLPSFSLCSLEKRWTGLLSSIPASARIEALRFFAEVLLFVIRYCKWRLSVRARRTRRTRPENRWSKAQGWIQNGTLECRIITFWLLLRGFGRVLLSILAGLEYILFLFNAYIRSRSLQAATWSGIQTRSGLALSWNNSTRNKLGWLTYV